MANWARLQEQLTGLPVVKRAKHSIHFDKGNGEIVANFSGAPCHYEDKGVWKPIDTTLLLGADGFYGCPHSPVKVHQDGRVKVTGSDYSQFTKLPGSPLGRVDGDKIVREFPGGYQELFVTENGFREVITVIKPTFPIEKFLAKQSSGTLPSAYKTRPQTAVDANGDVFEITSDTKAFGDWLEGAVYPVVIDPDFNFTDGVGADTLLFSPNANSKYPTYNEMQMDYNRGASHIYARELLRSDLSSITNTMICTAASLKLTAVVNLTSHQYDVYKVSDANGDWVEDGPSWNYKVTATTAWAGSAGMSTAGTDYVNTVLATVTAAVTANNQAELTFNASGIAVLQSWFGDATNNGLLLLTPNRTGEAKRFHSSESATASYRPVLSVTYSAGGNLLRVNMSGNMQSLTGGMN